MAGGKSRRWSSELRAQPIAAIYTSPCQSAEQTAEALGEALDVKVKTLDKLQNLDHGLWQGMLVTDVKTKQPKVYRQWQEQPETVCPPQGETLVDAEERLQAAVAKLTKKHKTEGLVAVVLPEPLASVLRHVLRHDDLGDLWQSRNGTPAVGNHRICPRSGRQQIAESALPPGAS